jgi:hypothetical protein
MILKLQDVLFLLKLVALHDKDWSYNKLAVDLGMSPAEVHAAGKRAVAAQLAVRKNDRLVPNVRNLTEFLIHGARYVFVPERGELTRGMLTIFAAPPLSESFVPPTEPPPVWPDPQGAERGTAFAPLSSSAPVAARADRKLYELFALVDAVRGGRARERRIAAKELEKRVSGYDA